MNQKLEQQFPLSRATRQGKPTRELLTQLYDGALSVGGDVVQSLLSVVRGARFIDVCTRYHQHSSG